MDSSKLGYLYHFSWLKSNYFVVLINIWLIINENSIILKTLKTCLRLLDLDLKVKKIFFFSDLFMHLSYNSTVLHYENNNFLNCIVYYFYHDSRYIVSTWILISKYT